MLRKYLLISAIAFSGAVYGYNVGVIAGALIFMQADFSHGFLSIFASSFFWGITTVILFIGILSDKIGRRKMLQLAPVITIAAALYMRFTHNHDGLIVARYFLGVASAIISVNVPTYLSETVSPHIRGRAIAGFQLSLCAGILLATLVTLFYSNSPHWQWIFLYVAVPAMILLIASIIMPESPRWLVLRKKHDLAKLALQKFNSTDDAEMQYHSIVNSEIEFFQGGFFTLIKNNRNYIMPLALAIVISVLNHLIGINAFLQYDAKILFDSGFTQHNSALTATLVIVSINFVSTIIAMIYVDKFERKKILFIALLGIFTSLLALAIISWIMPIGVLKGFAILAMLLLFITSFALGPGSLIWTITSEILPSKIRARGIAIAQCSSSLASALLISAFLPLKNHINYGGIFILCAVFAFVYIIVTFLLPKTKGKTLEEIENI